jgi:hypothetical protein
VNFLSKFGSPRDKIRIVSKTNTFYEVSADNQSVEYIPPQPDNETEDGF